jgi:ATP phosphoribosyltransferase regulatory subunit HisZ
MDSRALYKQKYEAQLHEWKAELDGMLARSDKLAAQTKLDVKPKLDLVHAKLDAAKTKLNELGGVAHDKWDAAVKDADHVWHDLKSAAEGAYEALKQPVKD